MTSGVNIFAHVWGQKADTSSNYCDNIQPYDKTFQFLSNVTRFLDFFSEIKTNSTEDMEGSIKRVLLEIFLFPAVKEF